MEKELDQRVRMTKMMLRRGLIGLLEKKQLKDISVTELCRQSGINRGTFYAHYKDIDDLHRSIEEDVFAEIQKTLDAHPIHPAGYRAEKEQTIYYAVYDFLDHSSDLRSLLMNSQAYNPLMQKLLVIGYEKFASEYRRLHPGWEEGQIRFTFNFVAAGFLNLLKDWISGGRKEPVDAMAKRTEQLALACIKAK